jgi:hypothetical protein
MRMMSIILCNTSSAAHSRATGSSSLGAMHILLSISEHEEKRFDCQTYREPLLNHLQASEGE